MYSKPGLGYCEGKLVRLHQVLDQLQREVFRYSPPTTGQLIALETHHVSRRAVDERVEQVPQLEQWSTLPLSAEGYADLLGAVRTGRLSHVDMSRYIKRLIESGQGGFGEGCKISDDKLLQSWCQSLLRRAEGLEEVRRRLCSAECSKFIVLNPSS
jgi:hypothetical protein